MPIEILMPALSPTMTEGNLAKWLKKEGDSVSPGDVIAEIETDKATMEVESIDEGTLGKILVAEGTQNVPVNKVIGLLLAEGEDPKTLNAFKPAEETPAPDNSPKDESVKEEASDEKESAEDKPVVAAVVQQETKAPTPPISSAADRVNISPVAKKLAKQKNIDIGLIVGSGPKGRIVKADVEDAIAGGGLSRKVRRDNREFVTIENSSMRKIVAKRLSESKQQVPHFYLTVDCNLDELLNIRKQLNDKAGLKDDKKTPDYKLSVNDFVIKASSLAMKKVPGVNASWYDDAIVEYKNVDISVAVAIDEGLITPIVKNADQKTVIQISNEMKELAQKARDGKLAPEEFQGGGFSISNLGMYGVKEFSAIINPPQSCILAVGKGEPQPVVKNDEIVISTVMTVTLSVDHRAVDGALGAVFLDEFKKYIESPITMFA